MTESVESRSGPMAVTATRKTATAEAEGLWRRNPFLRMLGRLWREKAR